MNDQLIIRGKSVFENREGGTMTDDYFRNPLTDGTENITTDRYELSLNYNKPIKTKSEINFSMAETIKVIPISHRKRLFIPFILLVPVSNLQIFNR